MARYKLGTLNGTNTDVTGSPSNSQFWDYDAVGNWDSITTNSTTQTRTANKQNEITGVSGATTPAYDSNGNLTTDENNYRFVYDAWNKVVQVKNSSNVVIVAYGRDALHRHVTDTVGSTVTDRFFSSDWQLLETKVGSNTVTRNVWSPVYVDGLVLRDRDTDANGTLDERLYALQDANWNTTALVNTSGTVQERYTYTSFGQVTFRDGSGSTLSGSAKDWVFLHQGGEKIAAGDFEFRNRVYSPTLGRWLSNDPLGFEAGDQNWYRAIRNNPGNGLDPRGLAITAVDPIPDFNPLPERNPLGNVIDLPPVADEGYGVYGGAILVGLGEGFYDTFLDAPIKTGQFIIDVPMALNPEYKPMNPHFAAYLNGESGLVGTVFNITSDATSILSGGPKGPKGPKTPRLPSNPAKGNPSLPTGSPGRPIQVGHNPPTNSANPGNPIRGEGGFPGPSHTPNPNSVVPKIGHATPWDQMTAAERRAFQHSYSRHANELGLPSWSQKNAENLRQKFNLVVEYIRSNSTKIVNPPKKPFNGQSVNVNYYDASFHGVQYYYYETLEGTFISAGRAR